MEVNNNLLCELTAFAPEVLEILLLSKVQLLEKSFEDFPERIKWLQWEGFPLESLSLNLNLDEVVVLDMQKSCLVHAWEDSKELSALRVLYLNHSVHLVNSPDLSGAPLLESLELISFEGCVSLVEVHESVGNLERLEQLNMKGCISLVTIHGSFEKVNKLTYLNLNGCKSLKNLSITMFSSLERLDISYCSSLSTINCDEPSMTQYQVRCASPCWPLKVSFPSLRKLYVSKSGIFRADIFDLIKCAPLLEILDLSYNPIRVLRCVDKDACLRLESLCVVEWVDLQSISNIPVCCEVVADDCSLLEKITYIYTGPRAMAQLPGTYTNGCGKLAEIHCGIRDVLVIERQGEMDEDGAKYLGFPTMSTFERRSWGVYRGGIYSVCLDGDLLLSKWFTTTTDGSELLYTVPSSLPGQPCIQALNLGVSGTTHRGSNRLELKDVMYLDKDNIDFEVRDDQCGVRIENLSNMWEWSFCLPDLRGFWALELQKRTWLSHCCVMEHREIRPGDRLRISVWNKYLWENGALKLGIKMIYEEQADGKKQESCNSSSRSSQIKVEESDDEEEVASVAAVKCLFSSGLPFFYKHAPFSTCLDPVRAVDFGFEPASEGFSRINSQPSRVWEVTIENQRSIESKQWNWTLKVPYRPTGNAMTMAALYHLCQVEEKSINVNDVVRISVCDPTEPQLKLGIKIMRNESKDRQESINSQGKVGGEDMEEEVATAAAVHVASWYNRNLRSPLLDLSFFEIEKDTCEDPDDDVKVKKRYYRIGNTNYKILGKNLHV